MCPSPVSTSVTRVRAGCGRHHRGWLVGAAGRPQYPAQQPAEHDPQHGRDEQPDDDLARGVPRHQLSSWMVNVTRLLLAAPSGVALSPTGSPEPGADDRELVGPDAAAQQLVGDGLRAHRAERDRLGLGAGGDRDVAGDGQPQVRPLGEHRRDLRHLRQRGVGQRHAVGLEQHVRALQHPRGHRVQRRPRSGWVGVAVGVGVLDRRRRPHRHRRRRSPSARRRPPRPRARPPSDDPPSPTDCSGTPRARRIAPRRW